MIHPIIDEYYQPCASFCRSAGFAVSKGLVSNAPGAAHGLTPAVSGVATPAGNCGLDVLKGRSAKEGFAELTKLVQSMQMEKDEANA